MKINSLQKIILQLLPQHDWVSGTELMTNFPLQERKFVSGRLFELVENQQVQYRRWHEQGVSVPMFKRPIPEQGQISIF